MTGPLIGTIVVLLASGYGWAVWVERRYPVLKGCPFITGRGGGAALWLGFLIAVGAAVVAGVRDLVVGRRGWRRAVLAGLATGAAVIVILTVELVILAAERRCMD